MSIMFQPGAVWRDDDGEPINAHGGGLLPHGGRFWWYGEHKVGGAAGNTAQVGVRVYVSDDLRIWRNAGVALAVSDDPGHELARGCIIERPKVIHNARTGQFVMWFHLEWKDTGYATARAGVAVSDAPGGPYRFLGSFRPNAGVWPLNLPTERRTIPSAEEAAGYMPGRENRIRSNLIGRDHAAGQMSRDMALFVDEDGAAYHVHAAEENATLHISLLSDDYLRPSGLYIRAFEHRWMEAPAVFKRQGLYYMIASDCTGWAPNAARSMVAPSMFGPWRELGNPCVGTNPANGMGPELTFGGQSTCVFQVPGRADDYIAMFDIWTPDNPIDGRYAWLPITFADGRFIVAWRDGWSLEACDPNAATRACAHGATHG